ncbi:MAG: hypothetical protein JXQ27_11870 [Acidobacteria bacterium]|nr:hypothetical protein [Acidobacteriota bacterium]
MNKPGFRIPLARLEEVNEFMSLEVNPLTERLLGVVEKFGGVEAIREKHTQAARLETKLQRIRESGSPYLADLEWLMEQREKKAFISMNDYYRNILQNRYGEVSFASDNAVTLEISSLHYFPWLITQAKRAIAERELMPGRFIRVRFMKEQEADGDLLAVTAAMDIVGATWVETLDTKGTDGANVHLGGPETITGYFGGPGQPNHYPLKWVEEYLYYHTNYGVKQVLNINAGTVLVGYLLHQLGIDIEFKISVYMGNDNPYSVLWTLMTAKMFSRDDGTTPLIGFNFANSVNNETIELAAFIRKELGFEDKVRFEHHITETWKSIVRQPYDRTEELIEVSRKVKNISAKHEGGTPDQEQQREFPSDILTYFIPKEDVIAAGNMPKFELNYLDKHVALNHTAAELIKAGIPVIAAWNLHQ